MPIDNGAFFIANGAALRPLGLGVDINALKDVRGKGQHGMNLVCAESDLLPSI